MGCGGRSWSGSSSPRSCKPGCGVHPQRPRNESFLFADLAGYTALTEAHGDEHAADAAADFCAAVRTLLEEHGAEEVKAISDAMLLRVDDPDQAVRLAARIVTGYGARRRTLGIRVGVHTGTAVRRGGDWFGSAVNLASRVADLAGSGEVLLTDATRQALGALAVRELGPRKFKNVAEPLRVYSLALEHDAARLPVDPVCRRPTGCRRAARQSETSSTSSAHPNTHAPSQPIPAATSAPPDPRSPSYWIEPTTPGSHPNLRCHVRLRCSRPKRPASAPLTEELLSPPVIVPTSADGQVAPVAGHPEPLRMRPLPLNAALS
jgi:adenylate cyclase